jgi:hypothetical protein
MNNNNFSPEEIQRKDLISALTLWLLAEFIAFAVFPATEIIKPAKGELNQWFLTSLPLGLGGVLLFASHRGLLPWPMGGKTAVVKM